MDMTILKVLGSYLVARSRWADWWLCIIMRTMFDAVAKPITSRIELCRATAPTALPMDYTTEADGMEPTRALQIPRWESCNTGGQAKVH